MPTLPEGSESVLLGTAVACGAVVGLLVFSLAVWTARDIAARSRSMIVRLGALALVLFIPAFGLVAYLLLRPRETVADRYERDLIEEILAREISAARQPPQNPAGAAAEAE
jgi:ABC-type nickel/cobalt efflux system permease component RcnA